MDGCLEEVKNRFLIGSLPQHHSPLPSLWGETLISRWLKWRKFVNFSETDERAIVTKQTAPKLLRFSRKH
jgi:hypothetical protein